MYGVINSDWRFYRVVSNEFVDLCYYKFLGISDTARFNKLSLRSNMTEQCKKSSSVFFLT